MTRDFVRSATLLALTVPAVLDAQAKPVSTLRELTATPAYQANVARQFAQLPADVFQRCPTLVSNGSRVTELRTVTFSPEGIPLAGMWRQSFPVSGCGNDTTINLYFVITPDKKIDTIVATPGDTHADLALQRDAAQYVHLAMLAAARDCQAMHLLTSSYDGPPAAATTSAKQPWRETWTVSACSKKYRATLTFTPDSTGTAINVSPPAPAE